MLINLIIYTVYNTQTSDFPGFYVLRPFYIVPEGCLQHRQGQIQPSPIACISTDLNLIRQPLIEAGAAQLLKNSTDSPNIIESWV